MTQITDLIVAAATVSSAIATAASVYLLRKTITLAARGQQAQIFLEIAKKYNEIYKERNQLLETEFDWDRLITEYGSYEKMITGSEWNKLRNVAACFELIGVLVNVQRFSFGGAAAPAHHEGLRSWYPRR